MSRGANAWHKFRGERSLGEHVTELGPMPDPAVVAQRAAMSPERLTSI
jgi:hypothetical protein